MVRLTSELGFVYFVNNGRRTVKFADKSKAERYYQRLVEKEDRDNAIDWRHKRKVERNRDRISTNDSN